MISDVAYQVERRAPERPAVPVPDPVARTGRRPAAVESSATLAMEWAEHREAWERRVVLIAETSLGVAELEMPLRVTRTEAGGLEIAGSGYHLDLEITSEQEAAEISWTLHPGGTDARSRLAVLNLILALHGNGPVVLRDPEYGDIQLLRLSSIPSPEPIEDELAFYRSIVLIEEWSGYRLRLPEKIPPRDAARAWEAAWTIHDRAIGVVFISDIEATIVGPEDWRAANELRFVDPYAVQVFGTEVLLGELDYVVPVQLISAREIDAGVVRVNYRPSREPLTVRVQPPRADSEERAALVEAGEIPSPPPVEPDLDRQHRARELLGELRREVPPDPELRRQMRREWPTR